MEKENPNSESVSAGNPKAKKQPEKAKKPNRFLRFLIALVCVIVVISLAWVVFSMIGRVKAESVIPVSANVRVSINNPVRLLDGILAHETLHEISTVPSLSAVSSILNMLIENPLLKNKLLRFAARGNMELSLLPAAGDDIRFAAAWDLGLFSPFLRILPLVSNFINVPNLYYVGAGGNSRFEYRLDNMTLYFGPFRNLIFIANEQGIFESRSNTAQSSGSPQPVGANTFDNIKTSSYDAALLLSADYVSSLLSGQDDGLAEILKNIEITSGVEAGISIYPKKFELSLAAPMTSRQASLSRFLEQRSGAPGMAEHIPADAQYATIVSAGTLRELMDAALIFTPGLDAAMRSADSALRVLMRLSVDDLLFSWMGNEYAVYGMEGRPHPVYAISIADERRRQEMFDRAFRSVLLNEDARLNLDGVRMPRIEIPELLQALLRNMNIFLPSPYYIVHRDYFFVSESAETLLAALRAIQRNEILPRSPAWRNIASGRNTNSNASALSLYYSLDRSIPFFLRGNTALSGFLSLYRQGLARVNFNRGTVEVSLSLIPGSGSGVTLASGYPIDISGRPSNRLYGAGSFTGGESGRLFFTSGSTAVSINVADNAVHELGNQGTHWIIPADGVGKKGDINAWVVTDRGRVNLVDGNMEPVSGFPVLTGHRIASPPQAFNGKLYLNDEDGRVHTVDEHGAQGTWVSSFIAAVRSPPSFLETTGRNGKVYSAVYPKSFFGEIWLLDADGNTMPGWPASISVSDDDPGIGFGSPLLFASNNRVHAAFVNQAGQLLLFDENAAFIPRFPVDLDGIFYQQPVFDGEYLWLVSSDGTLFRVDLHGDILRQTIPNFSVMEEGYITVFDCDNDRVPEIFITGEGNALHAYSRNFRSLESFPLPVWGRPHFVPVQGNRKAEIFAMGMDRRLYRYQFR